MYKIFLLIAFIAMSSFELKAQEIKVYKTFGGVHFEQDTTELSLNEVMSALKDNEAAYSEIKKAKKFSNAAAISGFTGAILLAFPLGTAIAGGDPEWIMAASGAALLITAIPLHSAFKKHTVNALDIYNNKKTSRIKTNFIWQGTRAAVVIRF